MRAALSLVCFTLVGCATEIGPATSSETSALTESSDSVNWNPDVGCGPVGKESSVPCDGEFIWPANQGITSTMVLFRKGPDGSEGPTFLAFVVWNDATVGRILRATVGRKGSHLRATINNITATRTFGFPDFNQGTAGTASGGKPPPEPQPHIDDPLHFSTRYLDAARLAARNIDAASQTFTAYAE